VTVELKDSKCLAQLEQFFHFLFHSYNNTWKALNTQLVMSIPFARNEKMGLSAMDTDKPAVRNIVKIGLIMEYLGRCD